MSGFLMTARPDPVPPVNNTYRWATVTDDAPLTIQLDGDTLPLALIPDCLCDPLSLAVGDRVWTQLYGRRVVVHGAQGGGLGARTWPNEVVRWLRPSGTASTTSASPVDWPSAYGGPLTATIVKRAAASRVTVDVTTAGWMSAVGYTVWAISVDGAAANMANVTEYNQANVHMQWNAKISVSGLAVGSRVFTLQVYTDGVALNYNDRDIFSMTLREVAP